MASPFRLLIFDMDDTLVASKETWGQAEQRLFRLLGHEYDPRIAHNYKGCHAWDVGRIIYEHLLPPGYTAQECGRMLREYLFEEFRGAARLMPGATELMKRLAGRFPLAIASGSPSEAVHLMLERFEWAPHFSLVVSSESVAHGKPAPDVFLETAARFGCAPQEALVFEDSLHGVRAAKRAGMTCFVVPSSNDPHIADEADRTFTSLADITVDLIEEFPLCLDTAILP